MATFLDVSLLGHFGSIFVVFLVFLIVFGLLEYVKAFGDGKKGIHSLIALFVAFMFLVSKSASAMVTTMVPWFIIIIIFIFFVLLMVRMFGLGEGEIKVILKDGSTYPWIIIFSILVLFASLATVFGQGFLEKGGGGVGANTTNVVSEYGSYDAGTRSTTTNDFATNVINTLRHPKMLGMVFIFLLGMFILMFLTKPISLG